MLRTKGLSLHYGGSQILSGIDLVAPAGEVTCVMGTNGVGKTSLLKAVSGTHPRSGGEIWLEDEALGALAGAAASRAARDALVSSLASVTMSALKRVLLDGGSSRSFACLDSSQVRALPQRFFRAEVASLPPARPMAWRACVRLPRARVLTPAPARP